MELQLKRCFYCLALRDTSATLEAPQSQIHLLLAVIQLVTFALPLTTAQEAQQQPQLVLQEPLSQELDLHLVKHVQKGSCAIMEQRLNVLEATVLVVLVLQLHVQMANTITETDSLLLINVHSAQQESTARTELSLETAQLVIIVTTELLYPIKVFNKQLASPLKSSTFSFSLLSTLLVTKCLLM
jgi:hypothetical protein